MQNKFSIPDYYLNFGMILSWIKLSKLLMQYISVLYSHWGSSRNTCKYKLMGDASQLITFEQGHAKRLHNLSQQDL